MMTLNYLYFMRFVWDLESKVSTDLLNSFDILYYILKYEYY